MPPPHFYGEEIGLPHYQTQLQPDIVMINPNQYDQFVLRQKWTLVINRYFFSVAGQEDRPFWS